MPFVITVDIIGPFPNVAEHIVESIRVGLLFHYALARLTVAF